ncbi:hypothetical protein CBS101457_005350 [Exobasidium rhododendri]|nr:hypothetical protein CBS101457_005350 [Exobasidium rhododendri]
MAAGQYKYDNEGAQFLTFVLTFLLVALFPLTYSLFANGIARGAKQGWFDSKGQKVTEVKRMQKRSITNPQVSGKLLLLVAGWASVAFLFHKIANTSDNSSHAVYDPFKILDIAVGATEKEIKKHYKKLSIKFHPDKLQVSANQTKEQIESHFVDITKAYKSLTDETIRKNFEMYGHPDGRQEMSLGIALPAWVIEGQNNIWVLGIYGLVFGIGLPYLVARWWYGSRSRTKDGLVNATAQSFFQHLREDTPPARILALVAISEELQDPILDKRGFGKHEGELLEMEKEVRKKVAALGERWKLIDQFRSHSIHKNLVLLYSYLLRIETKSMTLTKERYVLAAKAEKLLNGMLSISLAHNWMDLTILLMDMIQSFVQAVPPSAEAREASELMQLPGITFDSARELIKSDDKWGPLGLQGLWKMSDAHRKKVLKVGQSGGMESSTYTEMLRVLGEWPRIEMLDAFFKVTGEKIVTPGAIVHYIVKMRTLPLKKDGTILHSGIRPGSDINRREQESSVRPSTEDDDETKLENLIGRGDPKNVKEGKQSIGFARAPYFLEERKPSWWVFISDSKQSRIIVQPVKCTDVGPDMTRTFSIQFQAPPQPGLYTFRAIIKSDCYLASEAEMSVLLKVEDASNLEEGDFEDDISEPDEDTLAGQMAAMRGDKVKTSHGGHNHKHSHGHGHSHDHSHGDEDDDGESGTDDDQGEEEEEDSESDWE